MCCYCSETLYYIWFRICGLTRVLVCNDTKTSFRFVITKRNLSARWFNKGVPSSSCTPIGHANTIRQAKQFLHNYYSFTLDGLHCLALLLKHFINAISETIVLLQHTEYMLIIYIKYNTGFITWFFTWMFNDNLLSHIMHWLPMYLQLQ